ncbi:AAA family ATPase, partial [Candidatus Micrarchaeota archaeon]|nr:AAA family ATPase [Candidatus Micrarchaeota archaeon]
MAEKIARVKTGIDGLDKALKGGFPKGNIVLISGGAGTGKSTLCMQYLYNGAKLFGEKGLYISTEQSEKDLRKAAASYGWDLESLEKKGLL